MKSVRRLLPLLACSLLALRAAAVTYDELAARFASPPESARPWVWWHWMNGNVSHDGITKDLEALRAVGIGGVILFEESDRIAPGPVRYLSEEHLALIEHAGRECVRLGLQFGFQNGPGWSSSGGPWVTPEFAMKHVTWSEQAVTSTGAAQKLALPRPPTVVHPFTDLGPPKRYTARDYYRDVAVIAFPTPRNSEWRLDDWQKKMGYLTGYNLRDQAEAPDGVIIDPKTVVDLTARMAPDGSLTWQAPAGKWTVIRFGYTLTEHQNREAPTTGATGLEIDKLSAAAADFHWKYFVDRVLAAVGKGGRSPASTVLMDSYEPLTQTWTPSMPADFKRLRNYDLQPYLLCLTGRAVGSVRETDKFLRDYRRTLADLIATNYYGRFEENCRALGLNFAAEGYGYYGTFFDDFQMATHADIPMGEFWAGVIKWHHWAGKVAASAADITDRHVVGAEAYTTGNEMSAWRWHPYTLKAQGDYFFCHGINRFYFQASAHQPWGDHIKPGMTMGPNGIQMNRNNTWFTQSRDWLAYLTRAQYVLQQGRLVADVFFNYGDNAPAAFRPNQAIATKGPKGVPWGPDVDVSPDIWTPLPAGRDFHVGNSAVLKDMKVNARGEITLATGQTYQVLLLPNDDRMDLATLIEVARLVEAGATVLGPRPNRTPSLDGGPGADARVQEIARQLWGDIDGRTVTSHRHGRGTVHFGVTLEQVLEDRGLKRDFAYRATAAHTGEPAKLDYIHRKLDDGEYYFVSNQRNAAASVECEFRVASGSPEIWQPETGGIAPALVTRRLDDGRVAVALNLAPAESCFVVFRKGAAAQAVTSFDKDGQPVGSPLTARLENAGQGFAVIAFAAGNYTAARADGTRLSGTAGQLPAPLDLSANWEVSFPAGWGAPTSATLPRLASYTENSDDGIKHFSGTAVYRQRFTLSESQLKTPGTVAELDLGDVQVIAELEVNGRGFGLLWKPPYRRDITSALKDGENTITVKVTNLWRNRLIGDAKIAGFTSKDQAKLVDQMLAGHTRLTAEGGSQGPGASDEYYPMPDWVWAGKPNPDIRLHTFTVFAYLNSETPLVSSGLLGPVRLEWGRRIELE